MARGQSPYQGNYTFPVASTVERSMQQAAGAQAQMFAGLGEEFGGAIDKYFQGKDEKKMAESMAENRIALEIVYGDQGTVPTDPKERIKDIRGVMRASGGYQNFIARMENFELKQQNKAMQDQFMDLRQEQILSSQQKRFDEASKRQATTKFAEWALSKSPQEKPEVVREKVLSERFEPVTRKAVGPTTPQAPNVNVVTGEVIYPEQKPAPLTGPSEEFMARLAESGLPPESMALAYDAAVKKQAQEAETEAAQAGVLGKMQIAEFEAELEDRSKGPRDLSGSMVVNDALARADELLGGWTTGYASYLKGLPATDAKAVDSLFETVKANIGFDKLQAMREASPTGGALGQVSDRELKALQAVFGNLDQAQSEEMLRYNMRMLQHVYNNIIHGEGNHPYAHPAQQSQGRSNVEASPEQVEQLRELEELERQRGGG